MPQSIYDNGGMIGVTLDFADTDTYPGPPIDPEAGLTLTRTESASSAITAYDAAERNQNAVFSADVTFPTSPSDGCLFEWGRSAIGAFVGLRDGGTVFRVRAGDGFTPQDSAIGATLDITDFPADGAAHNVTVDFQINPGRVRLWIDGIFKGEAFTAGNGPLESDDWAGGANGAYLSGSADTGPADEPTTAWPGTEQGAGLRFYANQLVSSTPVSGNQKNSGIWSLSSVLESIEIPAVPSNTTLTYVSHLVDNVSTPPYSFSPNFSAGGLAVISVHNEIPGGGATTPAVPTQVTIDGITATKAVDASTSAASASHTSIWYAEIPSGGTKSVVVQYSVAPIRMSIGSYLVQNYTSITPIFTDSSTSPEAPSSRTITTPILSSGVSVISAHTSGNVYSHTWSGGLTEHYDEPIVSSTGSTGASLKTTVEESITVTVTPDATPTQPTSMALAVWG